jgi:large subunit ribosomal protein L23
MALFDVFKKRKERERFDKKQKEREVQTEMKKPEALAKASVFAPKETGEAGKIILKPHVAEKATNLKEKGMYVFKVAEKANKTMIKRAIKETYGVAPRKINIVHIPSKKIFLRRREGIKPGFKKAVIFLKKGEKIEIS